MPQQLSLSARPRTLDQLLGQEKLVKQVRGLVAQAQANNSTEKAWLFSGPLGNGKTSIARLIALSYQCLHQGEKWGVPCKDCLTAHAEGLYKGVWGGLSIHEINGADISGKIELRKALEGVDYAPFNGSAYRIYIIDEVHRTNIAAQSLCLKLLEDSPETTIFILCTTEPQSMLDTLRSRCKSFALKVFDYDTITLIVAKLLKRLKSDLPVDRLVEALVERGVTSPRLICHAVENYVGGASPEEAAVCDVVLEVNTKELTRALVKGDWQSVSGYLIKSASVDTKSVRLGVIAYLRAILLESPEISTTTAATAKALSNMCAIGNADDLSMSGAIAAELYNLCSIFAKYPR